MIQDVLHNPSDHKWWKSFKLIDSPKHLWFWKLNNFFVHLLTIKALCPTVYLQKLNAFFLTLVYCHHWEFLMALWYHKFSLHESLVDWQVSLWKLFHVLQEHRHSTSMVCVTKGKKPCTHIIAGIESQWPITQILTSDKSAGSLSLLSRSRWLDNHWWVPSPTSPRLKEVGSRPGSTHYMPVFAFCLTCLLYRREPASQDKKTLAWENVRSLPDPARSLPLHSWDTISTWKKPMKQTIFDSPFSSGYTHWHYICWA